MENAGGHNSKQYSNSNSNSNNNSNLLLRREAFSTTSLKLMSSHMQNWQKAILLSSVGSQTYSITSQ